MEGKERARLTFLPRSPALRGSALDELLSLRLSSLASAPLILSWIKPVITSAHTLFRSSKAGRGPESRSSEKMVCRPKVDQPLLPNDQPPALTNSPTPPKATMEGLVDSNPALAQQLAFEQQLFAEGSVPLLELPAPTYPRSTAPLPNPKQLTTQPSRSGTRRS